jgi:hypothetical protein
MADPTYVPKVYRKQGGDEFVVADGGRINIEPGGDIDADGVSLKEYALTLDIADGSADADYYLVCPHGGTIKKLHSVIDGAVGTADITITPSIGGTPVTNGAITIATGSSAAGDVDSATPSAANVVTAGQAIKLAVAGGGSGGSPRIHVAIVIER